MKHTVQEISCTTYVTAVSLKFTQNKVFLKIYE